jgi:hypothetical protein
VRARAGRGMLWRVGRLGPGGICAGVLMTVAALLGPWSWQQGLAHGKPGVPTLLAIALLGPVLSSVALAGRLVTVGRRVHPVLPAAAAVLALAIAAKAAAGEATLDGLAPGGVLAAVGCALTAAGWLTVWQIPAAVTRRAIAVSTVAVLLVTLMGYGLSRLWGTAHLDQRVVPAVPGVPRPLDAAAGTGAARPAGPSGAVPATAGATRWRRTVAGTVVGVTGSLVVVREPAGIRTFATADGRPSWRFRRPGAVTTVAAVSQDGASVVVRWRDGVMAAFDAATGRRRWQRAASTLDPARLVVFNGLVVALPRGRAPVGGLDLTTGRRRWTWLPGNHDCLVAGALPADARVLAVTLACPDGIRVAGLFTGQSTTDTLVRWTWVPPAGGALDVVATAGGVLVRYAGSGVVLAATSGTAGASHDAPAGLVASIDTTALYLGRTTTAVSLAFGRALWTIPGPGDGAAVAATGRGDDAFVLLTEPSGGTRLRRLDLAGGAVRLDVALDLPATAVFLAPDGILVAAPNTVELVV